ncbi:hypothetical protein J3R30DRAFT_3702147 [Lentinula aciculospora]|uniref:Uncharacterized protein n=1 Tax=Lentinula aciculospora TaxID=153920 RepID=A0A9W9ABR6_9AGAR|nr:hypothetical protein J3R30DRAFT_3702147 [Lentinula aciculospora]
MLSSLPTHPEHPAYMGSSSSFLDKDNDNSRTSEKVAESRSLEHNLVHRKASLDIMRIICLFAHVSLIVLLVVLIALQPKLRSKPMDQNLVYLVSPVFSKLYGYIITGWTIVLTLTTQRLALRRQLSLSNSLTAKHDANMAWMGAGSALLTSLNWRDHGFKRSIESLFIPLAYLGVLSAFHSSATDIISEVEMNTNIPFPFSSYGVPNFTGKASENVFVGADSLMTMLSLDTFNFPGLADDGSGVIYDIPVHPDRIVQKLTEWDIDVVRYLEVNATYFDVTCGSLSGSIQNVNGTGPAFVFASDFGIANSLLPNNVNTFPNTISQNGLVIRVAPWGSLVLDATDPKSSWPSSILIFTTVPVFDSLNNMVEPVTVNPPMTYFPYNSTTESSVTQVTALACNLTVDMSSTKAHIDPFSNALLELTGEAWNKTSASLSPFPASYRSTPVDVNQSPADMLTSIWSVLPVAAVSPLDEQLIDVCNNSATICGILYEPEQFVMESLNMFPDIYLPQGPSANSIDLAKLENVLSQMTAIEFWTEGQGNNLNFSNRLFDGVDTTKSFVMNENNLNLHQIGVVYMLDIIDVIIPLIELLSLSLGFAIILLALAMPSLVDHNRILIDSIGILQMIWLANDHPTEDQKALTELDPPTTKALRKAGLKIKRNYQNHYDPKGQLR